MKILEEKENPLFNRKEIKLEIESNVTPSHADVEKLISEKFSTSPENIKINQIKGKFGVQKFLVLVNIYNSKEDKDNFEIKTKKQREAEKKSS
jgi:ribosomal protein S24E